MPERRFVQCDVFSPEAIHGNGLAVVVDAEDLTTEAMQTFAAWTNLAETTFILPADDSSADYKLRIFTPSQEMRFAGHPTLGSCAAWLHCGGEPKQQDCVRQECGVGIVDIDVSGDRLAFKAPPTKINPMPERQLIELLHALNISAEQVLHSARLENGPEWQVIQLESADEVLAVDSSKVKWPETKSVGLIGAHKTGDECDYEVRMLAPSSGMSEDPITGSLNAALALWLQADGRLKEPVTIAQGTKINRKGRVFVRPSGDKDVFIGGDTHIVIDGVVNL